MLFDHTVTGLRCCIQQRLSVIFPLLNQKTCFEAIQKDHFCLPMLQYKVNSVVFLVTKYFFSYYELIRSSKDKKPPHKVGRIARWIAFSLRTQRPRVRFSMLLRLIDSSNAVLSGKCRKLNHVDMTHLVPQKNTTTTQESEAALLAGASQL